MAFCKECGKPLNDGVAFCTECGVSLDEVKKQEPVIVKKPQPPPPAPQPTYAPPASAPVVQEESSKPVSTFGFFGMMLLFMLPIVGQIAMLIMAFAPRNKNIKSFARAYLIWIIIGVVLGVVCYFAFSSILEMLSGYTDGNLNELFESIQ